MDCVSITIAGKYHKFVAVSVLLRVCSMSRMSNIAIGNKRGILSSIAWYYGDNDFVIRTFDFIARSQIKHA